MLSYRTIFDGRAIYTSLIHPSNNIYIFTMLKKLSGKNICIKIGKNMLSTKLILKLWLSNQILVKTCLKLNNDVQSLILYWRSFHIFYMLYTLDYCIQGNSGHNSD